MKLIFIDTETTGTDPKKHGLIQLSGLVEIGGVEKETFDLRMSTYTDNVIEDEALKVNGLTREVIAKYDSPIAAYSAFYTMLTKYVDKFNRQDKFLWVGYNARFDADFVRRLFERNDDRYFGSLFFFPQIDVMNLAAFHLRERRSGMVNFKLATVAKELGVMVIESELHDALSDVRLTKALFEKLTGVESNYPKSATLSDVLTMR